MNCRICAGDVDDPFWDDLCPECQHECFHGYGLFEPSCGWCSAEAERTAHEDEDYDPFGAVVGDSRRERG